MIFKVDTENNRAYPVSLAPDVDELEYFNKYKDTDNLKMIEASDVENISLPMIFKNGNILVDEDFMKATEIDINTERVISILNQTDKMMISDFPISEIQRKELINFRQDLRDYSKVNVFPEIPSFLNKYGII